MSALSSTLWSLTCAANVHQDGDFWKLVCNTSDHSDMINSFLSSDRCDCNYRSAFSSLQYAWFEKKKQIKSLCSELKSSSMIFKTGEIMFI